MSASCERDVSFRVELDLGCAGGFAVVQHGCWAADLAGLLPLERVRVLGEREVVMATLPNARVLRSSQATAWGAGNSVSSQAARDYRDIGAKVSLTLLKNEIALSAKGTWRPQ